MFVEVKARSGLAYGAPTEAVTRSKRRRLGQLAADYAARNGYTNSPCRFDVVSIRVHSGGTTTIEVYQNAFSAAG